MLDKEQLAAVTATEKRIVVVAGAGSGKTRVITERIKHLLNNGATAANIVCITFTNAAADEMVERLGGVPGIGDAFIGTIHSFAHRVLKCSKDDSNFEMYSKEHEASFHRYLINKYCKHLTFERWLQYKDILEDEICGKVSEGSAERFLTPSENIEISLLHRSVDSIGKDDSYPMSIQGLCRLHNVISFDELLERAIDYFNKNNCYPEYVLVDEFQDIGPLEYSFIKSLRAENYYFVGDDWQSIYSFKGGNVEIFKGLIRNKGWKTYYLKKNYRNSKQVLNIAESVIMQVKDKLDKKVERCNKEEGSVLVDTKDKLNSMLKAFAENEDDFGSWFFLARTNQQTNELLQQCKKYKIPAITFKREGMSLQALRGLLASNVVKILTVHASKGLEAKNVLLYGNFPVMLPTYLRNPEERRVMYVGITRAKENLIILN